MIELFLSTDGKHTVHISAQTPEELAKLVPVAQALYQQVLAEYGAKGQPTHNGQSNGQAWVGKRIDTPAQAEAAVAPVCPAHQKPMKYRQGRLGPFWSCPTRLPTGEWCNVTKEVYHRGNGQAHAV